MDLPFVPGWLISESHARPRTEWSKRRFIEGLGSIPVILSVGKNVRIVEMRGCMGDVRHKPRDAIVRRIYEHTWEQDGHKTWMAEVQFTDDGSRRIYPASCTYWHTYEDGVGEYYY